MNSGASPIVTMNGNSQKGGNVSDIFNNLAVPAGLLYMQQSISSSFPSNNKEDEVITDTLYDRLLGLATGDDKSEKKRQTRRKKNKNNKNNKKTRSKK